jgi:hypothetical protein
VARVARGAGAAFVLFFGTVNSALFSLSSAEMSSLVRLVPRTGFGATLEAALAGLFAAGWPVAAVGVGRVRRVPCDGTITAGSFAFLAGTGFGATIGAGGSRISIILVVRLMLGTRLMRRSRRDRRLAHCASHMARSLSFREVTVTRVSNVLK